VTFFHKKRLNACWTLDFDAEVYMQHLQHRANFCGLMPSMGVHIPVKY
jgi:hypothetical protein